MPASFFFRRSVFLVLVVLMPAGCSPREKTSPSQAQTTSADVSDQQPVQGDWVIQRIDSDPDTLNPITTESTNGQMICSAFGSTGRISEGLLQMDDYTLKLKPALAESYEISPDQLTYTFHLRHGVRWHDGVPFTADDVKYSFDETMDPKVRAEDLRSYLTTVKSCDVLDPYTVRFTTTERYFKTLEVLGTFVDIVPKHILTKGEPDFNKHPFGRHPIGTGPYKFVRWDTGSQIVLERNDDYWGGAMYYPKRLVFEVIEEPYIAGQLLKKGEIDAFDEVSPVQWEHELKNSRAMSQCHEIVYPFPSYTYMGFNLRNPMFADIRVRHAIDLLMPRDEIINQVYLGQYADKCSGYDPQGSINYNHDVAPTPYDPAQALQLLNAAGWKNDHGDGILYKDGKPLSFTLLYPSSNPLRGKMAELIQESLRGAGIDLKLSQMEFVQLFDRIDEWKFDACIMGWSLDINGDPSQLWAGSEADIKKSSNFIGYKSAEADRLMAAGKLEYDSEKRAVIYRQLQRVIHDDYPVCFLVSPKWILIVSNRYQNVKIFAPTPCFDIMSWWVPRGLQKYGN
jgi:peptide/nickel transport system substrate-binding protein